MLRRIARAAVVRTAEMEYLQVTTTSMFDAFYVQFLSPYSPAVSAAMIEFINNYQF